MAVKRKALSFMEYMTVLFFILDTSTIYKALADKNLHILEVAAFLLVVCFAMRLSVSGIKRSTVNKYLPHIFVYYLVILFIFIISIKSEHILGYIARFVLIYPLLVLYYCYLTEKGETFSLLRKYVNIMAVLAAISLFFWVFASQLHWIAPTGTIRILWGSVNVCPSYFGLYSERQMDTFLWYSGFRNQGIFTEGPMHSLCLVLAIAAELFLPKQKARKALRFSFGKGKSFCINWKLLSLIAALITTFTTTGQILLILMLVFRYFMSRPKMQFNYMVKLLAGLVVAAVGGYAAISIFLLKAARPQWMARVDNFITGFRAWLASPIWGSGYSDVTTLDRYRPYYQTNSIAGGFTNSITQVLAQGGLLFLLVYIVPVYRAVRKALQQRNLSILMLAVILMLELIFTICAYKLGVLLFFAFLHGMSISEPSLQAVQKTDGRQRTETG